MRGGRGLVVGGADCIDALIDVGVRPCQNTINAPMVASDGTPIKVTRAAVGRSATNKRMPSPTASPASEHAIMPPLARRNGRKRKPDTCTTNQP